MSNSSPVIRLWALITVAQSICQICSCYLTIPKGGLYNRSGENTLSVVCLLSVCCGQSLRSGVSADHAFLLEWEINQTRPDHVVASAANLIPRSGFCWWDSQGIFIRCLQEVLFSHIVCVRGPQTTSISFFLSLFGWFVTTSPFGCTDGKMVI